MSCRPIISVLALFSLTLVTGCRDFSVPTAADPEERMNGDIMVEVGEPFQLAVGQEARVADRDFTIQFDRVMSDTRCVGASPCAEPGDARILAELRRDGGTRLEFVLSVPGGIDNYYYYGNVIQDRNETIRLLRLEPYPSADGMSDPASYTAFILVQSL